VAEHSWGLTREQRPCEPLEGLKQWSPLWVCETIAIGQSDIPVDPGYLWSGACCFIVELPQPVSPPALARHPEITDLLLLENVSRIGASRGLPGGHALERSEHGGYSGAGSGGSDNFSAALRTGSENSHSQALSNFCCTGAIRLSHACGSIVSAARLTASNRLCACAQA
jgi:hypothetical protein